MVSESGRARKGPGYLVARVSSHKVDNLAAFQSDRADLEAGGDDEPDHDNEYDHVLNEPI